MLIFKLNALTNFIAFIVGIFYYKYFPKEIKFIFYFVAFGVLTESYIRLHQHYIMKNVMPIGHFYYPIAFLILGLFYLYVLKGFIKPVYTLITITAFEIYCIVNTVFMQSLLDYPSLVGAIGAMILVLFSAAYFTKIMVEAKITKLSQEPLIWINSAILFYYAGNFFYHSLYNLRITTSMDVMIFAAQLFSILNLFFYLIIAISFLKVKRTKPKKVSL